MPVNGVGVPCWRKYVVPCVLLKTNLAAYAVLYVRFCKVKPILVRLD